MRGCMWGDAAPAIRSAASIAERRIEPLLHQLQPFETIGKRTFEQEQLGSSPRRAVPPFGTKLHVEKNRHPRRLCDGVLAATTGECSFPAENGRAWGARFCPDR